MLYSHINIALSYVNLPPSFCQNLNFYVIKYSMLSASYVDPVGTAFIWDRGSGSRGI